MTWTLVIRHLLIPFAVLVGTGPITIFARFERR